MSFFCICKTGSGIVQPVYEGFSSSVHFNCCLKYIFVFCRCAN